MLLWLHLGCNSCQHLTTFPTSRWYRFYPDFITWCRMLRSSASSLSALSQRKRKKSRRRCGWWVCVILCFGKGVISWVNTLRPKQNGYHFADDIFGEWKWLYFNFNSIKSTLIPVMAWCPQATSHYMSQCWAWYIAPYGIIRPQWVYLSRHL